MEARGSTDWQTHARVGGRKETPLTKPPDPVSNVTRLTFETLLDAVFELPDGHTITLSTRLGIVTVSLEFQGELHWQQVHRYVSEPEPDLRTRIDRTMEAEQQPKRKGGRPRLYPERPKPLTLGQVIGADDTKR